LDAREYRKIVRWCRTQTSVSFLEVCKTEPSHSNIRKVYA